MPGILAYLRAASIITIVLLDAARLFPQRQSDYFYQRRRDGSEAVFNPLVWMLNSGYFTLQIDNRTNKVFKIQYASGGKNVWRNLRNPIAAINKYGWKNFAGTELFPTSLKKEKAQWVPNYLGHLLGGGVAFRKNQAWYRAHGYEHPTLCALLTNTASGLLNEIVENNDYRGTNVDPIADLLIFEPLGILLFGLGNVEDYCGGNFDVAYWPLQPVFDPFLGTLENAGHGFVFKYKPPFSARLRVFFSLRRPGNVGAVLPNRRRQKPYLCSRRGRPIFAAGWQPSRGAHLDRELCARDRILLRQGQFALVLLPHFSGNDAQSQDQRLPRRDRFWQNLTGIFPCLAGASPNFIRPSSRLHPVGAGHTCTALIVRSRSVSPR